MRKILVSVMMGSLALLFTSSARADQPKNEEEEVLQRRTEAFVAAFNKGDAKALAGFFTAEADLVDPEGHHTKGREAIADSYAKFFSQAKGAKLFITITSQRIPKPDLALEDGLTEVIYPHGGPPSAARYSVVYVKQDGEWYLESVREAIAVPPTNADKFHDLAFLIGEWAEDVKTGGSATASYSLDSSNNFMLNTFDLTMNDIPVAGGKQWIAWDASVNKPRGWSFLSNGGFAEGLWTKDADKPRWKIAVTATQRDGKKITATNIFTKIDDDHLSFRFIDRKLDGKPLPDVKEVKMKRVR